MVFSLFIDHHHNPVLEHFHPPKNETPKSISSHSPVSYPPRPLVTTNLLSVLMDLPILGPFIWIESYCIFFNDWLLSLKHKVSKVTHVVAWISTSFPLNDWMILHYMDIPHFVYLFISWQMFGLFHLRALILSLLQSIAFNDEDDQTYFRLVRFQSTFTSWSLNCYY